MEFVENLPCEVGNRLENEVVLSDSSVHNQLVNISCCIFVFVVNILYHNQCHMIIDFNFEISAMEKFGHLVKLVGRLIQECIHL